MQEIERKFLITSQEFKKEAFAAFDIAQGFLSTDPERTVRIRIKGEKGFLTVKGKSNTSGTSRFEWEKEIDKQDAEELLVLCKKGIIVKKRYKVQLDNHVFEVDEFFGDNEGLIVAEVELQEEHEAFSKPKWLGKEVTGQHKYYNSQLSLHPYTTWK